MRIETERLIITDFLPDMAEAVHQNSLDADNRRFVPDEVFETVEDTAETIEFLIGCYGSKSGRPLVYPVLLKDGTYIGYVQAVPMKDSTWEIGYHTGDKYRNQGYATEAVRSFLPVIMKELNIHTISGNVLSENIASVRVMEHCGFIKQFEGEGLYQGENRSIIRYQFNLQT